jgi:hypothetical protein
MTTRHAATAMHVLDLMLRYFRDGKHWSRETLYDPRGRRWCLLGMHRYVCRKHHIPETGAIDYLREALGKPPLPSVVEDGVGARIRAQSNDAFVALFNTCSHDFARVRDLILSGRALAQAEQKGPGVE